MAFIYFDIDEILPKIHQYQQENDLQDENVVNLPRYFNDFNEEQFAYTENFICSRTIFKYTESYAFNYFDNADGTNPSYYIYSLFKFKCVMMRWANNRVRVSYLSKALGGHPEDKNYQKFIGATGNLT